MTVNIGINLRVMWPKTTGGMEHYIRQLIKGIINRTEHRVWLFLSASAYDTFEESPGKLTKIFLAEERYNEVMLRTIREADINLWFCPLMDLEPRVVLIPSVVNIPDVQHEYFPEYFSTSLLDSRRKQYLWAAKHSNAVLTLSEFSRQTIVDAYDIPREKVFAIPLDVGDMFDTVLPNHEYFRTESALKGAHYFLYPANAWPHKDHGTLIQAFATLLASHPGDNIKLVLTGVPDLGDGCLREMIESFQLCDKVLVLGHIKVEDLKALYMGAVALVFPSRFEGFGMPIVEALKTGCPIVSSDATCLPEVAGDAALYFRAGDSAALAAQMKQILGNADERMELVEKGKVIAQRYNWNRTVEETVRVFETIVDNGIPFNEFPKVSVITPSYNQGQFIKETIDSVLSQTYPNIEYVVVDGGSVDETVTILRSYGNKIRWISEKDSGQADAVNKGIRMTDGTIIGWLNSDDTYFPTAVEEAVRYLLAEENVGVVYGDGMHVEKNGKCISLYPAEEYNWGRLAENCFICQPAVFFRRDVIEQVGLLRQDLQMCMDYDLWIRLGKNIRFTYIPSLWATSRMYEENKTLGKRDQVYGEIMKTVYEHYRYVPLEWLYGYWHYRFQGKTPKVWKVISILHFSLKNWRRPNIVYPEIKQQLKKHLSFQTRTRIKKIYLKLKGRNN